MRLLTLDGQGDLAWAEFSQDKIPPYAILSHTWESEEVTFLDLTNGNFKNKAGYRKILFCGEQAARDKLRYFWVDTCCIDKSNNTELTKAINSMFRWYRNAVKCYAYLSDVSCSAINASTDTYQNAWEPDFRESRWFTRGWTLQELLAPASVIFYSAQLTQLGNKQSLAALIHDTTGIPMPALQGQNLETFGVDERMAWATRRQTTEVEDNAYCLLGIFNVFMPLIYGEGKDSALRRLRREVDGLPTARTIGSTCFAVPFERNSRFTGRESILADLEAKLFVGEQTAKIAIVGLGGVGKTQLAIELAYRTRTKYQNCSVFWIPATDIDSLHQAYRDVARQLRIPGSEDDKADVKKLVQDYLSRIDTRPWLLVIDNADDISMWIRSSGMEQGSGGLKEYLPKSTQGCIVFTTRDKKTAIKLVGQNIIEVPELGEDVAVQLLQKSLIDPSLVSHQRDAWTLVNMLTYLPLAIVQAAAYINENVMMLRDYISLLDEQEESVIELLSEEFEDDGRYPALKNPVATTWMMSFEKIRNLDPLAADYLSFMACIDRKDIPQSLLPTGKSRKEVMEAIGTLKAYSFIVARSGNVAVFDIHRLVHLATRNWLRKEGTLCRWARAAIDRLDDLFPGDEPQKRAQWRALLPHAAYALRQEATDPHNVHTIDLKWKYARSLHNDGRFKESERPLQEILEAQRSVLGEKHPDTLLYMSNLALSYQTQGRFEEARELDLRVIKNRKEVLGEEHPDTLTSMNNLAVGYYQQGRWDEAEKIEVQLLETRKRALGEEHPSTLTSIANLASTYWKQGRWSEAEELKTRVMETRKRVLGEEHPDTLRSAHSLASTYWERGRWSEAEELEVQVLATSRRVLGNEHPDTLLSMLNIAVMRRDQGRNEEAVEHLDEYVHLGRRVHRSNHPDVLRSIELLQSWRLEKSDMT